MRSWIARPILAALAVALTHGVPLLCIPRAGAIRPLSLDRPKRPGWLARLAGSGPATRCLEDAAQVSETIAHLRRQLACV